MRLADASPSDPNRGAAPQRLRGGEMMVNDNQISLQRHSRELAVSISAVFLLGADDISFCDNQAEVENDVIFVLTNCLAISGTLRFNSNRLQKRITAGFLSAITWAVMNETSLNQSTHCIFAIGPIQARVVVGNRSVFGLFLPQICRAFDAFALSLSGSIGKTHGLSQTILNET